MRKRVSTPETVLAKAHPNNMGRDEMNLAEFPLATLADRAPRGCKTLVFEDRIWDRGQAQHRVRRLTISASDKYGLPTAIDDEVILGLVQVSKAAGFADRWVRFSRYRLIHLLGWRDEGRSYRRLEHSLKRWLGVTLYYENAWWDKERKRWVDANFHLLDELVLYRRPKPHAGVLSGAGDGALSSFTWNEIVFRSFRTGFLKQLDLDLYRRLKLSAAKRMYRFLDKRFHFSSTLRFKLAVFACKHIGLSRRYDVAQLKRRLAPAVAELEQAGYLVPLPTKDRFHRLRRGEWEVVFVPVPKPGRQRRPAAPSSELESQLVERGVTASMAAQLIREHAGELIRAKIAVFDALREGRDRRISQNPAGFLVQSIRNDYLPPADLGQRTPGRNAPSRGGLPGCDGFAQPAMRRARPKARDMKASAVAEHLSRLSPAERKELEARALSEARGVTADGYRRAVAEGNSERVEHYRQVILKQYIEEVVQANAAVAEGCVTQQPT